MAMTNAPSELTKYPMSRTCPFDLPPEYERLRSEEPVTRCRLDYIGKDVWIVTTYEHACAVLSDVRFSSDYSSPGFPWPMTPNPPIPGTFIRQDPPHHTRLRSAVVAAFKPKRIEAMRPAIQQIVDKLIDEMLDRTPPVDLIEALAIPLPEMVICEMLGVPYADRHFFSERVRVIGIQRKSRQRHAEVRAELETYLESLVTLREGEPSLDVLGGLVTRQQQLGDITRQEVIGIGTLLLIAGYESLANTIGLGTITLLCHPDQHAELREDPSKIPRAIEELLRYQTVISFGLRRAATADVEIGGQLIRAGDGVIVLLDSANRDEAMFESPNQFNIHGKVDHHLAFGFGSHACIGQALARLELELFWSTLLRRVPTLRLAVPFEDVQFRDETFMYGVDQLPVTWSTTSNQISGGNHENEVACES